MSYPLPSREIIADSTEFMVEAHQFDGMVMLPGCGLAHAVSAKKRRIAKQSGRRIVEMVKEDLTPRKIMTREALRNGIKVSMAMGASTNSTLHLPAIAHEGGIDLSLDDFDQLSREVPYLCNIKPSGQYPLSVLEECGGIPAVMERTWRTWSWWKMTSSSPWSTPSGRRADWQSSTATWPPTGRW